MPKLSKSHPDLPVGLADDSFRFERYALPLVDLLASSETLTPLTIGIYGPWGSGKSTLLEQIEEEMRTSYKDAFVCVRFNPWIHRREPNILVPLLHCLHDALDNWKSQVGESLAKIFNVLTRLGADYLLKTITLNAVDLDRLEELEKSYVEAHKEVESEMRKLRNIIEELARELAKAKKSGERGPRLVVLIDDLDRCQPEEIIDILEAIKLFLDVENVIVLLAVDKEVIDRGIEVRYEKFKFGAERAPALGAEYLEKMVQLPLTLLPLETKQVGAYLDRLGVAEPLAAHRELLASLLLPNPRKIKRVLNILAFSIAIMERGAVDPKPIMSQVIRLVVLQAQDGALYDKITRQPELLDALQVYYEARAQRKEPNFSQFAERGPALLVTCKEYHRPGTYLSRLFEGKPFQFGGDTEILPTYLTLLGA